MSVPVPHALRRIVLLLALGVALGSCDACGSEREPGAERAAASEQDDEAPAAPSPDEVYAPKTDGGTAGGANGSSRTIVEAFRRDEAYADRGSVQARRLVYRVSLRVPPSLGNAPKTISRPSAELFVDVSADRLRARFAGSGWPVDTGSEVRIRRDEPGAYVFDARGGRPLGPGKMVSWFQGGRVRRHPHVRILPPDPEEQTGPGTLMCRLLAEWSNEAPDALEHRCGDGGSPPRFRIGPWRAERTADVAVELPSASLRADHESPPRPIPGQSSRAFLPPPVLARLKPFYVPPTRRRDAGDLPAEGLRVVNSGRSRVIVIVRGVPVGWVDRDAEGRFAGLSPGNHRVGAMRPVGVPALPARTVRIPGEVVLER